MLIECWITNQNLLNNAENEKNSKIWFISEWIEIIYKSKDNVIPYAMTWDERRQLTTENKLK